jgi:hypothetical protein
VRELDQTGTRDGLIVCANALACQRAHGAEIEEQIAANEADEVARLYAISSVRTDRRTGRVFSLQGKPFG